nr:hypothetical protein YSBCXYJI_YSBCXYJI_CDS_0018 [Caudoviricetes sp.]
MCVCMIEYLYPEISVYIMRSTKLKRYIKKKLS